MSKSPSGRPNWRREVTWSIERSISRLARPTEPVPSDRRPLLSTSIAMWNPSPASPRTRLHVVGVRAGVWLGQREAGEPAARCQVGQEPLLLLVVAEQHDALHPDRLVHAEGDGERPVDLPEGLEHPRVARLRQALA